MEVTVDTHLVVPVLDASHTGEARRAAVRLASRLGFDEADAGRAAVVVTEAAGNIVKHAHHGHLLLRPVSEVSGHPGLEVLALDRGGGIADVARAMEDGYSTAGSPGTGLGAISRLANFVDIHSAPGQGTVLLARVLPRGSSWLDPPGPLSLGAVRVAAPGESECGDDWAVAEVGGRVLVLVADGLGHGSHAARASAEAVRLFRTNAERCLPEILDRIHRALMATRGAAVSVAEVDPVAGELHFVGVGNVAGFLAWPGGSRNIVTQNGTLGGGQFGRIRQLTYPWSADRALVLHTDGLTSQAGIAAYPGLLARDPAVVAAVLYRDFLRGRDDATVVVGVERRPRT